MCVSVCLCVCLFFSLKSRKVLNRFSCGFHWRVLTRPDSNMGYVRIFRNVSFAHSGDFKCAQKRFWRFLAPMTLFLKEFPWYLEYRCIWTLAKTLPIQIFKYSICAGGKAFNCAKYIFCGISLIKKRIMMLISI